MACFLMVSMMVCGYLCLTVKETTRDYEHGSIFTGLYIVVIIELLKYLQGVNSCSYSIERDHY